MLLLEREVRETGCATLLLKDEEGTTNERTKPAVQAMETIETAASFISLVVGVSRRNVVYASQGHRIRGYRECKTASQIIAYPETGSLFRASACPLVRRHFHQCNLIQLNYDGQRWITSKSYKVLLTESDRSNPAPISRGFTRCERRRKGAEQSAEALLCIVQKQEKAAVYSLHRFACGTPMRFFSALHVF